MPITIVSGANHEYREFYFKLKEDAFKLGYEFLGYDYGGLNDGVAFDLELHNPKDCTKYVGKIPDKPKMLLNALERVNGFVAYMDCDVRIKQKIDEVIGDYDIGITAHDPKLHSGKGIDDRYNFITCYLNAGVIFLNNTEGTKRFINEWIKKIKESTANSDQEGLTNLLRSYIPEDGWGKPYHKVAGAKVKLLPASKYNFIARYGYDEPNPKIVHYTGLPQEKISMGILRD